MLIQPRADSRTAWDRAPFVSSFFGCYCCFSSYFRVSLGGHTCLFTMAHYRGMSIHLVGVEVSSSHVDHEILELKEKKME